MIRRLLVPCIVLVLALAVSAQQTAPTFGGNYSSLDARRQRLIDNWVARFNTATGQKAAADAFYDEIVSLSAKVTFDAVTNALMQSSLTGKDGAALGDALSLVEQVDSVRGQVPGASGDRQFRMYVRLTEGALGTLDRSNEFKRGADNSIYHKGYPLNYREQGGAPSIQISIAPDRRRADVDVDYRSSSFPAGLFNGHLSSSNSDVRAGNNYDRHVARWLGFQNWWRGFFGVRLARDPEAAERPGKIPMTPRAGKKTIDVMMDDFLKAWLAEGDVVAAMGYVSERSFACLPQNDEGGGMDPGMAPFQIMINLKAAHDALPLQGSLDTLTRGVRLANSRLKVVQQPHHSRFVIYAVPDDIAAAFDCENRLAGQRKPVRRAYGNYFGSTFYVGGQANNTVALLWARENGYWKIVSWQTGIDVNDAGPADAAAEVKITRIAADRSFVDATHGFLESWLIRKDYDAAFQYLSERGYACYDLVRAADAPAASSVADAGQKIRAGMARAGDELGKAVSLESVIAAVEPVHPAVRIMNHPYSRAFTLTSWPSSLADAADCAARARGESFTGSAGSDYGNAFGMNFRFRSDGGEAAVLRTLWLKENGSWHITAYDVEVP